MKLKHTAYTVLLGCILLQAGSTGVLSNCLAIFNAPIATEFNFSNLQMSTVTTIRVCFISLGVMFGSRFYPKMGMNRFLTVCAVTSCVCVFAQTYMNDINQFRAIQTVLGFSLGSVMTIPVILMVKNWFNERQGLFLGIALAASGISGALISPLCSTLVLSYGWRVAMMTLGVIALVVDLPATVYLCRIKPEGDEVKYGKEVQLQQTVTGGNGGTLFTLVLAITMGVIIGCINQLTFQFSLLTKQMGLSIAVASALNSACMIGNTGGKVVLGMIKDRIGPWKTLLLSFICIGISLVTFVLSEKLMIISALVIGASFAVGALIPPFVCNELYSKRYTETSSLISGTGIFAGALFGSLIGYLSDLLNGYTYIYLALSILCFICLINIFILKKKGEHSYE